MPERIISQSYRIIRITALGVSSILAFIILAPIVADRYSPDQYLMIHSVLEFVTIFVSFTIFSVVWLIRDGLDDDRSRFILFLGINFFAVGVFDTLHALTFEGMPEIFTVVCAQKSTVFWLFARYWLAFSLLTGLLLGGLLRSTRRTALIYLIINIIVTTVGTYALLVHPQVLPELYATGKGLTLLKVNLGYLLIFLYGIILAITWRKSAGIMESVYLNLAYFALMTIISEATLTRYEQLHDIYNLFGHVFKAAAYYFLFRAVYCSAVVNHFYTLGEMAKMNAELLKEDIKLEPIIDIQMTKLRKILPKAERIAVYTQTNDMNLKADYVWGKHSDILGSGRKLNLKMFLDRIGCCITIVDKPMQILELFHAEGQQSDIPLEIPIILSNARHIMYIPLYAGDRHYGVIILSIFRRFSRFTPDDMEKAKVFQQFATLTIAQANSQATITRLSYEDSLTGLPNRRFFFAELDAIKEASDKDNTPFTVVYLDMNGLKHVNDTLGHHAGDLALKLIGKQLKQYIHPPAFAVRLGGDEFAAVFPGTGSNESESLIEQLRQSFAVIPLDENVHFALAVGGAIYPTESSDLEILLKLADDRMYEHKRLLKAGKEPR